MHTRNIATYLGTVPGLYGVATSKTATRGFGHGWWLQPLDASSLARREAISAVEEGGPHVFECWDTGCRFQAEMADFGPEVTLRPCLGSKPTSVTYLVVSVVLVGAQGFK